MARLLGPDMGSRYCYLASGAPAASVPALVYSNAGGTVPADILAYDGSETPGATILGSQVATDGSGQLSLFWFPDGADQVFVSVNGGTVTPVDADYNRRIDGALRLAGGAMTGAVTLSDGSPAASEAYVTTAVGAAPVVATRQAGMDNTGVSDCTAAINTLFSAVAAGGRVYWPKGTYKITGTINPPSSNVTNFGDGFGTLWEFAPATADANMITLDATHRDTKWIDMRFRVSSSGSNGPTARLFRLNGTFRNSFHRCTFVGRHVSAGDSFAVNTHIGAVIMGNSGDNQFIDCDFLNLGVGIKVDSIQNSVIGGKFGTCWIGIWGTQNIDGTTRANAGMSITGHVDFVSSATAGLVAYNILIDAPGNQWWLSHCWFEGADTAIKVGDTTAAGGPSQFGFAHSKIAAMTKGLDMVWCRQPRLDNLQFAASGAGAPTSLTIDATRCPEGVATNLMSFISGDPALGGTTDFTASVFPTSWQYLGRTKSVLNAVNLRGNFGAYGTSPVAKPTVTGSRAGNAALASLLTGLANQGLITDSTTA